ncbi:hypothetical protein AVEN_110603-1 [Araneus ventricosus]|uniref:Uncharacterized protein n=1 Tax=Araneus ventricosus TaxID=182803 RepID=A0A4Y2EL39_ARAVE|nr:hypothetical protein AVEN_110603-1 [Araneus ventricosus]
MTYVSITGNLDMLTTRLELEDYFGTVCVILAWSDTKDEQEPAPTSPNFHNILAEGSLTLGVRFNKMDLWVESDFEPGILLPRTLPPDYRVPADIIQCSFQGTGK